MNLFAHQQNLLSANPAKHLLAWGTGTGKTRTSLMLAQNNCKTFLIVCPKTLKENWRREVVRWLGLQPTVFNPKKPEYGFITIISKEEFKKFADILPRFAGIIVDEAHTFAGITSQLSKSMAKYLRKHSVHYRWFLTATPFLRNAWNVYTLGKLLGQEWDYIAFRHKFFYERFMGTRTFWDARPGKEDEVAALVHQLGSTVKLEDCIDIPDANYEIEHFKLTKEQIAAMKKVTVVLPIVRFTKYHQIAGGTLTGNEYEKETVIESEKKNRILELAEEHEKMIISCRYLAEMEMLKRELFAKHYGVLMLNGETKDKQAVLDDFNGRKKCILIVNAACCEGWQAPSCQFMVFYSYSFSLKDKTQMEGRIRRIDRPQKVSYLALVVDDSIDEDVVAALERKMDFDAAIYDYRFIN